MLGVEEGVALISHRTRESLFGMLSASVAALIIAGCGSPQATATPAPTNTAAAPSATRVATTPTPAATQAPTPTPAPQPKYGGTLTLAQTADPPTFNIYGSTMALLTNHTHLTHNRLLRFKSTQWPENAKYGDLTVVPDLAESWTVSNDGTTFTFKLRKGVAWHNVKPLYGREVTSADIQGAFELLRSHPKSVFKGDFSVITKMETPDRYTFTMTIPRPLASWLFRVADGESSSIAAPDLVAGRGVDYGVTQDSLAGTGPFLADKAEPGSRYIYVRNPDYFEKPYPYLDRVQWLVIPDASTREAAFISGQIHSLSVAQAADVPRIQKASSDVRLYVGEGLSGQAGGLIMNLQKDKWKDVRVRQAVKYATPWERVINDLFGGKGSYDACVPTALRKYSLDQSELKQLYRYDPQKSKDLLAAAGFSAANPMAFDLQINPDFNRDYVDIATMIKAELDAVGFKVTLTPFPIAQGRPRLIDGNFEAAVANLAAVTEPDDAIGAFVPGNPSNYGHIDDPKITAWHGQQQVEFDEPKRIALLKEFGRYCADQALHLATPKRQTHTVERGWIKNYGISDFAGDEDREKYAWVDRG